MNRAQHKAIHRLRADSQNFCCGITSNTSPTPSHNWNGQSVENIHTANTRYWFAIRATRNRAQAVYASIMSLGNEELLPYLPMRRIRQYNNKNINNPFFEFSEKPVHPGLLFVFTTYKEFKELLNLKPPINGLTPFYNHFRTNEFGRNDYLIIPTRQNGKFQNNCGIRH